MSQLAALKSATTLHDVAALLGFKASALSYVLYKKPSSSKYSKFSIQKRYGGMREICAPVAELKLLQRRLSDLLQNCAEEINASNKLADQISHGFKRGRSIITNAKGHRNRRFVFNADLTNFFGEIHLGRIRGFFIKDKSFSLNPKVATVLSQIACFEGVLPQGSPCSPVISNLISHVLDIHLVNLASKNGCTYSRYADDLTFSTNLSEFPSSIAKDVSGNAHEWIAGSGLEKLVLKSGFSLNPKKTRMQYKDSRQEVTGLVVNKKINVRREYRHTVRAMVHRLLATGEFSFDYKTSGSAGAAPTLTKITGSLKQLHGMLGFIDGVDSYNKDNVAQSGTQFSPEQFKKKERMYKRFLLFKEFYAAQKPVILCEGSTDNVYILHAIRSLAAGFPQLASKDASGKITLNVRIFKYTDTSTGRILNINGGTGEFPKFMSAYKNESLNFTAPGKFNPVILLIDNDKGATGIYSAVKQITGTKPTGMEPYVHVAANMYLTATPISSSTTQSTIEDFFDNGTKSELVNGKTFNSGDGFDPAKNYGKSVFAHKVVKAKSDTIDFKNFSAILTNIAAIIDLHKAKHP